jgi:hypothetical protein
MNKRILEYLSVVMTDTCTTCYGQGDRCVCDKEVNKKHNEHTFIETYEEVDEAEEDRIGMSRDRLIRCDHCSQFACICGDYDDDVDDTEVVVENKNA